MSGTEQVVDEVATPSADVKTEAPPTSALTADVISGTASSKGSVDIHGETAGISNGEATNTDTEPPVTTGGEGEGVSCGEEAAGDINAVANGEDAALSTESVAMDDSTKPELMEVDADRTGSDETVPASENTNNNSDSLETEAGGESKQRKSQSEEGKSNPDGKTDPSKPEKPKRSKDVSKYWSLVDKNRQDFSSWTKLITALEKEAKLEPLREGYDEFLLYYPFCYGYWKKYADLLAEKDGDAAAEQVYDDGVVAVGLSIDLWVAFIEFYINNDRPEAEIRALFERAVNICGLEFRSDRIWDMYIDWEVKNDKYINITQIYRRLLSTPTKCYSTHYDNVKEHINTHEPWEILTEEEIPELIVRAKALLETLKAAEEETVEENEDVPPGISSEDQDEKDIFDLSAENPELMSDRLKKGVRAVLYDEFKALTEENEKEVKARWSFEESIKRPYFHSKPLDTAQLKNWRRYLDYEIANGGENRAIFLFERCMIACAQYEEFWLKYTTYLEGLNRHTDVRNVYTRACRQHLPYKASIHITWAFYEERQGDFEQALSVINNIELQTSDNMCVLNHKLNLLRRHGDDLCELFTSYINKKKLSTESIKLLTSKYARYLLKIKGDADQANDVLTKAISKHPSHEAFYTQLLDVEYQRLPLDEGKVLQVFDLVSGSALSAELKQKFYSRRYEFVDDLGSDVNRLYTMYQEHEQEQATIANAAKEKKRPSNDKPYNDPAKKPRTAAYPTNPVNTGYQQQAHYQQQAGQGQYYGTGADWNAYYQQQADYSQYGAYHQYPQQQQQGYGGYTGYDYSGYY